MGGTISDMTRERDEAFERLRVKGKQHQQSIFVRYARDLGVDLETGWYVKNAALTLEYWRCARETCGRVPGGCLDVVGDMHSRRLKIRHERFVSVMKREWLDQVGRPGDEALMTWDGVVGGRK